MFTLKVDYNKARYRFAYQILPKLDGKKQKILELGAGNLEFANIMKKEGYQVYTAEIDMDKVKYAQISNFLTINADFNNFLPFKDNSFEGVVMLEVIEHIVFAERLLSEIFRILKADAFLLLSTPNFSYYFNRIMVFLGSPPSSEWYHYRFFTRKKILNIVDAAGFSVVNIISSAYIPFYNRLRRKMRLQESFFVIPKYLSSFFGNGFFVLAKKP